MGRQSSRIVRGLFDHKQIVKGGYDHVQVWHNGELVWEKLAETAGFQFILRTSNTGLFQAKGNFTVDWGDGRVEEYNFSELSYVMPSYNTSESLCTVTISGSLLDISFQNTYGLIQVLTPFPETMSSKEHFLRTFYGCGDLVNIPEDLFVNCSNAYSFWETFREATELNVPENLFSMCVNALSFYGCFKGCLFTTIPEKLFANCIYATDFSECFLESRVATIPDNLFSYNTRVTTFEKCFYNSRVKEVPSNLFGKNTKLESVENCFGYCSYLTTVAENVFDGCPNITNFNSAFYNCQKITSAVPELWNRANVTDSEDCFYYCINAENYSDIPSEWR